MRSLEESNHHSGDWHTQLKMRPIKEYKYATLSRGSASHPTKENDHTPIISHHKYQIQWFFGLCSATKRPCGQSKTLCYNLV